MHLYMCNWWISGLVPEDIGFFQMLGKHGQTMRFEHPLVGGAISNAENAKDIKRRDRYEAACHVHVVRWAPRLVLDDVGDCWWCLSVKW